MSTPTNLPYQLTSFIGRESDIAEVKHLLAATRLLTLTGSGGCGKTRLALEVAASLLEHFADGVWFIEFAAYSDKFFVPQVLAQVLGIQEQPGQTLIATVQHALCARSMLLVLDNCEHLLTACAYLSETLLRSCPSLRILATSREMLNIGGETTWRVPSLSFPETHLAELLPMKHLREYESVRLFLERAALASPSFVLTAENVAAVIEVCQRLDGIPLALELAATCVRVLSVEQIAARLDDRFRLLTGGSRTVLPRQQTLQAALDWSYSLLSTSEQQLFQQLSVFAGSFALEAVEALCHTDNTEPGDTLFQLIHKSLVVVEQQGRETRYRLLETIRLYSQQKLQLAEQPTTIQARYCNWYLDLAEKAAETLLKSDQQLGLKCLDEEHDNVRAALAWALKQGEGAMALRLGVALWNFWRTRGYLREGIQCLEAALAKNEGDSSLLRVRALNALGWLAYNQGENSRARALYEESLILLQELGEQEDLPETLYALASTLYRQGYYEQSSARLEESLALFRSRDSLMGVALILETMGVHATGRGDYESGQALLEESLQLWREMDNPDRILHSLYRLGDVMNRQAKYLPGRVLLEESLTLARSQGNKAAIACTLCSLGYAALEQGNYEQAVALLRESLVLLWEIGDKVSLAWCLERLACLFSAQAQKQIDIPLTRQDEQEVLVKRSARLWGASERLREVLGVPRMLADRHAYELRIKGCRMLVKEASWIDAWAKGRDMPLQQIINDVCHNLDEQRTSFSMEEQVSPALRIFALGVVQVYRDEYALTSADWIYSKGRELLFYLLCHQARTRGQIGLALWPDASAAQLRSNLRVVLYHLRRALGSSSWICYEGEHYSFNRQLAYWFDIETFEYTLTQAWQATSPTQTIQLLEQAITLYKGDFLEDIVSGDWVMFQRETLHKRYLEAQFTLGQLLFEQQQYARAAEAYRHVVEVDRYYEAAYRELMRCYACLDQRGQALQQYQLLQKLMHDEFATLPDAETTALFERLQQGNTI